MSKTCGTAVEYSTVAFKQGGCFGSSVLKMDGFDHTASFTRTVFDKFIELNQIKVGGMGVCLSVLKARCNDDIEVTWLVLHDHI